VCSCMQRFESKASRFVASGCTWLAACGRMEKDTLVRSVSPDRPVEPVEPVELLKLVKPVRPVNPVLLVTPEG